MKSIFSLIAICFTVLALQLCIPVVQAEDGDGLSEDLKKKLEKELKKKLGEDGDDYNRYENAIPMRWRIYSDQEAGIAFRFPYFYSTPDQYKAQIVRRNGWFMHGGDIDADIEMKSSTVNMLNVGSEFADQARALVDLDGMEFVAWDYYQNPESRPHVNEKWAPEGVEALLGKSDGHVALVLRHDDRVNALVCTGTLNYKENSAVLDTMEVMQRPKNDRKRKRGPLMTYREFLFAEEHMVLNARGQPVKLKGNEPAHWSDAWEVETAHYHITCQVSPGKAFYYAALCEALYRQFYDLYEPETVIPYKMEIHIFNTFKDFSSGAGSIGIPVSFGTGGFFYPTLLCIFAYEESTQVSSDFTPDKVIAHELSHQFLHLTCNGSDHVPTWINEGLAVYFETFEFKRGKYINKAPRGRIAQLVGVYRRQKDVLWSMDNYIKHYGHIPGLNYAEVYAMTHFWVFGAGKPGKKRFVAYWKALKNGEDGTEAFERIFLEDIIKAKGSRGAAIQAWETLLQQYVIEHLSTLK